MDAMLGALIGLTPVWVLAAVIASEWLRMPRRRCSGRE